MPLTFLLSRLLGRFFTAGFHVLFSSMTISGLGLFACLHFGMFSDGEPSSTKMVDRSNVKQVGDYRKDLKAFVKRTKNKSDFTQRFGAVVDLCQLHQQIVADPRFGENLQLKGFRAVAADRLIKCRREIEVEMKRRQRYLDKISKLETTKQRGKLTKSKDQFPSEQTFDQFLDQIAAEDMQTLTQITGGAIRVWSHIGGSFGANGICDFGPDLVSLIENTIQPDSWRSNGGAGVIFYYRPLRILVVSASSQVHDNVTDLLNQLR